MVGSNARILLVQDDPCTQKLEQLVFEQEGYAVDIDGSGEKGLTTVMATNPDLVDMAKVEALDAIGESRKAVAVLDRLV